MDTTKTSEALVNIYQTPRRHNPEDGHIQTHRSDNLKSYVILKRLVSKENNVQILILVWILKGSENLRKAELI